MKTCCIAVIGHVDHGKTSLVRALTGTDTDRLPEEKARGLSIATGFAHCRYPAGIADFVDTPGHTDFVAAMVGGTSGARAAMIVVSAIDGIAAQTSEHLEIAALLGIRQAVVAVTKADLLPEGGQTTRLDEIRKGLALTSFADAPLILCSAQTGAGLDHVHAALAALVAQDPAQATPLQSFLPIDRVFTLPGRGTIVSGTLLGRKLNLDDPLVLLPANRPLRLRGLQSRGADRASTHVGERMAANLRGVSAEAMKRGDVLCAPDAFGANLCLDVAITLLPDAPHALRHMQDVRLLIGTTNTVAQVRVFGGGRIAAGQSGLAQMRMRALIGSFTGQRAILRSLSPASTLGGAVVLDPLARPTGAGDKERRRVLDAATTGDVAGIAESLCAASGGVAKLRDVLRLSGLDKNAVRLGLEKQFQFLGDDTMAAQHRVDTAQTDLLTRLAAHHARHPLQPVVSRQDIIDRSAHPALASHAEAALLAKARIRVEGNAVALAAHDPLANLTTAQRKRMEEIEQLYRAAALSPPARTAVAQTATDNDIIDLLGWSGRLVSLQNISLNQTLTFHVDALTEAMRILRKTFPLAAPFSTSDARSTLDTSRRVIVPVLEHFDAIGLTLRNGNTRQMAG